MRIRSFALMLGLLASIAPIAAPAALAQSRAQVWVARFDGSLHKNDEGTAVAVSPDGATVFMTGSSKRHNNQFAFATVAFDAATGALEWSAAYVGGGGYDFAEDIAVSPDGTKVFVTGGSEGAGSTLLDYATVAYDAATGAQLWVARYDSGSDDFPYAVGVSPDGSRVFVTGSASLGWFGTVAYDAGTGAQLWVAKSVPGYEVTAAHALALAPDGTGVYVSGYRWNGQSYEVPTIRYDAVTGATDWVTTYDTTNNDLAYALAVSATGDRVFLTGETQVPNSAPTDYLTVAFDTVSGNQDWVATYDSGPGSTDVARSIAVQPGQGTSLFVTGSLHDQSTQDDYGTVAYDEATGAQLWVATYDGPAHRNDDAEALAVLPATGDFVYVTGASYGTGTARDLLTIAYRAADGTQVWALRYNGAGDGDDAGADVAASAARQVFSAGTSHGRGTQADFVVVSRSG